MRATSTKAHRPASPRTASALLALLVVVAALPLAAASFNCRKATTLVEKTICGNARLSRLDEELAETYRDASAFTVTPKELKEEQVAWLRDERKACEEDVECLEHAMLLRMARLRWSPATGVKLFAEAAPPASIFGRYSETEPVCVYTGTNGDVECEGEAESYIDLRPGTGNRVLVRSELTFFNGHICDFESEGEWVVDELRVPSEVEDYGCVLILRFRDGKIITDDPGTRCRSYYCGARGGYNSIELPKLSPEETDAKRRAAEGGGER